MFKKSGEYFCRLIVFCTLFSVFFLTSVFNPRLCFGKDTWENNTTLDHFTEVEYSFGLDGKNSNLNLDTDLFLAFPLNDTKIYSAPYLLLDKIDKSDSFVNRGAEYIYEVEVANKGSISLYDVAIVDVIPGGFSYIKGSTQINGVTISDPINSYGKLFFKIGEFPSYTKKILSYKVKVINNTIDGNYYSLTYARGKYFEPTTKEAKFFESKSDVSDIGVKSERYYSAKASSEVLGFSSSRSIAKMELVAVSVVLIFVLSIFYKKGWRKLFKASLLVFMLFIFLSVFSNPARAVSDMVLLSDLPQYTNTNIFKLSYVAVSDSKVNAKFFVRKDGDPLWHQFAWRSGYSGWVGVLEPSAIYSGDGKYIFKVEINDGLASDESSTIIDRSLPSSVSVFKSEKTDKGTYRLSWKNPNIDDLDKILIYRSTTRHFVADRNSEVGEVDGVGNAEVWWEDASSDSGGEYFYSVRVIDRAGNVSGLVSDVRATTVGGKAASVSNLEDEPTLSEKQSSGITEEIIPNEEKEGRKMSETLITYLSLIVCVVLYILYERKKSSEIVRRRSLKRKIR